jgi:hypothetical protein
VIKLKILLSSYLLNSAILVSKLQEISISGHVINFDGKYNSLLFGFVYDYSFYNELALGMFVGYCCDIT